MSRQPPPNSLLLEPGIRLDARRAVFLEQHRSLLVSDVHLGYPWVNREQGETRALTQPDRALDTLLELQRDYQPQDIIFVGDLIHGAAPLAALENELCALTEGLSRRSKLTLLLGNHDQNLADWTPRLGLPLSLQTELQLGCYHLLHGHLEPGLATQSPVTRLIIGHEHPAVDVNDGAGSECPCFLVDPTLLVMPAFSLWAPRYLAKVFLGPLARRARFHLAAAIREDRLVTCQLEP